MLSSQLQVNEEEEDEPQPSGPYFPSSHESSRSFIVCIFLHWSVRPGLAATLSGGAHLLVPVSRIVAASKLAQQECSLVVLASIIGLLYEGVAAVKRVWR